MDARFVSIAELGETPSVAVVVDVMRAFTVAAWAFAQGADKIVLAESLEKTLARARESATFVITGEDGQAEEDLACAQYIAGRVSETGTGASDFLQRGAESRAAAELRQGIRQGVHPDDVALCLELDRFPFAMIATLEDSLMVLRPHAISSVWRSPRHTASAWERPEPVATGAVRIVVTGYGLQT